MSSVSEDEITIRQVLKGDARAFELLVDKYQDVLGRFVYKVVPNPADREEVCQDVFVKVYLNLDKFRFDAKFTTWLYQIAYRTAVSFNRRKRLDTREYEDEQFTHNEPDPVTQDEIKRILDREVARLKLDERTIVTLYYLQEMSIEEISVIVEKPSGTVKNILYRVRQKLQTSLARTQPELLPVRREAV